jgi:hypothetical protein
MNREQLPMIATAVAKAVDPDTSDFEVRKAASESTHAESESGTIEATERKK